MAQNVGSKLERLIEHFLPVNVSEIEAAFEDVWRESSPSGLDSSSVRLRVSNMVMWGLEDDAQGRFEHLMDSLGEQHPCRGIVAILTDDVSKVDAGISAHCWRSASGTSHICSEEILLRASPTKQTELASAVLALLVPELPVHLWLVGDPDPLRRLPDDMFEVTDALYLDSAAGSAVGKSFTDIQGATAGGDARVVDLAWQRCEPWRELVAQLFDGNARLLLEDVRSLEVTGGLGSVSSAALLTAGWLVSCLDLTSAAIEAAGTRVQATFYDGSRPVMIDVVPDSDGAELRSVILHAGDATLSVELHEQSQHLHIRSDWSEEQVRRTVATEPGDDTSAIMKALQEQANAAVYAAALRVGIALAG